MSKQKAAVITGSSGALGRALCRGFVDAGYYVVGIDKVPEHERLADAFLNADLFEFVAEPDAQEDLLERLRSRLAEKSVAVLINNAAIQVTKQTRDLTLADWQELLYVNLLAAFLLSQKLITELCAARGCIINIASIHARLTKPSFVAYATSKAALVGLTQSMAVDLGPEVRVNALAPAAIDTPMLRAGFDGTPDALAALIDCHPLKKIGQPVDVANAAVFMASQDFVSGSVWAIDGGVGVRLHDPV